MHPPDIYFLVICLPPIILSLTVHEFAHARTALAFGDDTARLNGRVSLNPIRHLDPLGTLVLIVTQGFGWAKPVPVNPANLHPPRLGGIMVSLAGPMANLMLAATTALLVRYLLHFGLTEPTRNVQLLYRVLLTVIQINVGLAVFNLLPIFPLDGHHIARDMLPEEKRASFMAWQVRHGWVVLLAVLFGPRLLQELLHRHVPDPLFSAIVDLLVLVVKVFHLGPAFELMSA